MTQTQINGDSDPDRSDSGPDAAQTPTLYALPTPTQTPPPDHGRGRDDGPDSTPTLTPTPTEETSDTSNINDGRGSGPGDAPTQTPTQTPTGDAHRGSWFSRGGYLFALTAIVSIVASLGQKKFAEEKAKFVGQIEILGVDLSPWFAPAVFDLAVAALLHGGLQAARSRLSPWPWWIAAAGVAAVSIATNATHTGAEVTAPASAVLFLIWGLHLYSQYRIIVRAREAEDSAAEDFLQTDMLFTVNRRLAERAWLIARTNSIPKALAYRHSLGEVQLTPRYLTVRAAEIYLQVYDDQMDVMLHPDAAERVTAEPDSEPPPSRRAKIRFWNRAARRTAVRLADMTASDEVKRYLGVPVLDRSGVVLSRYSYQKAEPVEESPRKELPAGSADARHRRALPPPPDDDFANQPGPADRPDRPRVRARRALPSKDVVRPSADDVLEPGKPGGNAGANWLPLPAIAEVFPGVRDIDPGLPCECNMKKPCGRTLLDHTMRRGQQVVPIIKSVGPTWATREERIGKNVVLAVCELSGSGPQNEIAGLFDHLRKVAQRPGLAAPGVVVAEIEAAPARWEVETPPPADDPQAD